VPLNISDETNAVSATEKFAGFLGQSISFVLLRAIGHESDAWILHSQDMTRIGGSHERILHEVLWLTVRIGACVNECPILGRRREHGCDRGPVDSRKGSEFDQRCGDSSSRVSGAYDGIGLAFLHQIHGTAD
jgi:hypothetical protein